MTMVVAGQPPARHARRSPRHPHRRLVRDGLSAALADRERLKPEDQIFHSLSLTRAEIVPLAISARAGTRCRVSSRRFFAQSFLIAASRSSATCSRCSLTAFAFARLNFRLKKLWFALMLGTLMLPYHVTLMPQYVLFLHLGWVTPSCRWSCRNSSPSTPSSSS
jgi:ABC-type glycerol-3-phosphate transport system permease component